MKKRKFVFQLVGCNIGFLFVILFLLRKSDKTRDPGKPPNPVHNVVNLIISYLIKRLFKALYCFQLIFPSINIFSSSSVVISPLSHLSVSS